MRCYECKLPLLDEIEVESGLCERCADKAIERNRRRDEWDEFHPGEPCPKEELEP